MTQQNLAAAFFRRIQGEQAANFEQAIDYYQQALAVYTREGYPQNWARIQTNLAGAFFRRIAGDRSANLEQAIDHCQLAFEVYTWEAFPEQWAGTQTSLATVFSDRIKGERAANLEQGIEHFEQALEVYTREAYPEQWAMIQHNLANAYCARIQGERAANLEQAIVHYQQALEVRTLEQFPADHQRTQHSLGDLYFGEGDWAATLAADQGAIRAEQVLLESAYTEVGRRAETAQTSRLYARAAYALLKLDKAGEALEQLEQGKTRLLARALALNEVDLSVLPAEQQESIHALREAIRVLEAEMRLPPNTPGRSDERTLAKALEQTRMQLSREIESIRAEHPDFMPAGLTLSEILALIPPKGMLVAPVVTSHGSAVFIVPGGRQTVTLDQVLWLEDFKTADLQSMLIRGPPEDREWGGWLDAYLRKTYNLQGWLDAIEMTGQVLWDQLIAPLHWRLSTLGIESVLLMPQAGLGLLPLHAAWRDVDGVKRYFLDDYTITYVPSAYALSVSQGRLQNEGRHRQTLFAVVNPTKDLPFTQLEGEQVAKLFVGQNANVLVGDDATPEAVRKTDSSYLHFSCHGFYDWDNPMQSGLVLANKDFLTLAAIIGSFNLDTNRLVTLSACETGITDIRQSPDEFLGLSAGFLLVGAPAVVSTLWAVNDLSTMLLMEHFYRLHLQESMDIAVALRQAQIWLRDVTAGELAERFAAEEEIALGQTRMPIEAASEYYSRFAEHRSQDRPFAHPYYWAAFTFSGA